MNNIETLRNPNYRLQKIARDVAELNLIIGHLRMDITDTCNRLDNIESTSPNTNTNNFWYQDIENDNINELQMHLAKLRTDVNELQRQMTNMREWRNSITPLFELVIQGFERYRNNQQNLQQANDQ